MTDALKKNNKLWWYKRIPDYSLLDNNDNIEGRINDPRIILFDRGNISGISASVSTLNSFLTGSSIEKLQDLIRKYGIENIRIKNTYKNIDFDILIWTKNNSFFTFSVSTEANSNYVRLLEEKIIIHTEALKTESMEM